MPVMDGYALARNIRDFYLVNDLEQPYIVAVTGNVEHSQIEHAWDS